MTTIYGRLCRGIALTAIAGTTMLGTAQADPIRVGNSQPTYSFLPLDIGIAKGFFKKQGVEIQKTDFSGSAQLHQAIAAGSIDIGEGAGPEFGFLIKGAPEKAILALSDAPADLAIVVLKDGPIKDVAGLKDKKLSMSTRGSLAEWAGHELSKQQGWGPNGLVLVPLGAFSAQTAALKTRQVDGMVIEATTAARLDEEGTGRTVAHLEKTVPHFHIHVSYASDAFIKAHPDDVRKFLAGWFEALDYMKAHKAEAVAIGSKTLNLSEHASTVVYDELIGYFNMTGRFDPLALDTIAQSLVDVGQVKTKPDLTKYYNEEFLPPRH